MIANISTPVVEDLSWHNAETPRGCLALDIGEDAGRAVAEVLCLGVGLIRCKVHIGQPGEEDVLIFNCRTRTGGRSVADAFYACFKAS
ncbi:MAG: hypothetical protein WDZ79_01230 [Candidatus Paceibacterota bacterium]